MKKLRVGLVILFLAQFALFWQYAKREIAWAYPSGFDQATYLALDYGLYQEILQKGLFPALGQYFREPHATGFMLPVQDCAIQLFFGPGRLSALLINFGYLVLLEAVFFTTARWLTGRTALGWIGCGLLMMEHSAFLPSGGLFDCRIDLIGCCLYGTFVCLLVRSDALRERRWLAAAAGCAVLMVMFRFITFGYLVGFCLTLLTLLIGLLLFWRGGVVVTAVVKRATGRTVVLGMGLAAVCGTMIALHWKAIHDYYVVGHMTGNEKHIRAVEAGIEGLGGHLTYYLLSLLRDHLGTLFLTGWLALAAWAVVARRFTGSRPAADGESPRRRGLRDGRWLVQLCIVGASLFSPWFILTLDESKSPVVANVLTTPAALLVFVLLSARPARPPSRPAPLASGWGWPVAATLAVVCGGLNWLTQLAREGMFSSRRASVEQIGALYDFIGDESRHLGLNSPRVSADMIYDWMVPNTINDGFYEHQGRWLGARASLGTAIFAVPREEVFAKLAASDFVLLSTFPKEGPFPFYDSIRPLTGEMAVWCETHLLRMHAFEIDGGRVTVYARSNVPLEGLSGEWITPAGVRVRLAAAVLDAWRASGKSSLVLDGTDNPTWLPQVPTASARVLGPDGLPGGVVCAAEYLRPTPGTYRIRIDLGPLRTGVPPGTDAVLDLRLEHAYFVPKDVGINDDTRQLIANAPATTRFE